MKARKTGETAMLVAVAVSLLVTGCTSRPSGKNQVEAGDRSTRSETPSSTPSVQATETVLPKGAFRLQAQQAQEVATVIDFIAAYNRQRLDEALRVLSESAILSDCDYGRRSAVELRGKTRIAGWLRQRFNDGDRLTIRSVANENPQEPIGAIGVEFARRTNGTLTRLGYSDGIVPTTNAKVVFAGDGRIERFANGPIGADSASC